MFFFSCSLRHVWVLIKEDEIDNLAKPERGTGGRGGEGKEMDIFAHVIPSFL